MSKVSEILSLEIMTNLGLSLKRIEFTLKHLIDSKGQLPTPCILLLKDLFCTLAYCDKYISGFKEKNKLNKKG